MLKRYLTISLIMLIVCLNTYAQKVVGQVIKSSSTASNPTSLVLNIVADVLLKKVLGLKKNSSIAVAPSPKNTDTLALMAKINKRFDDPFYHPFATDVEVTSFSLEKNDKKNNLYWVTTNEYNVAGFMIEKSADGQKYLAIGSVETDNKLSYKQYLFEDEIAANDSIQYSYKLRVIGLDAEAQKTIPIKQNSRQGITGVVCMVDKFTKKVFLVSPSTIKKVQIIDSNGKVVFTKKKVNLLKPLDTNKLVAGTYTAKVYVEDDAVSQLFFKIE